MKYSLSLMLLLSFTLAYGQDIEINKVEEYDLVYLINGIKELSNEQTDDLSLRMFSIANLPGSAGNASGEVTHDLLIAVSEYDEAPNQSLFRISSFYNPKIMEWKMDNPEPIVVIEYGPYNDRKAIEIQIGLQKIALK
uniref:DUF3868 domain-containing protein n=1 Tax=Roseihalotalea indica TaxID=2867963 RepID=A0AA49GK51_9BACT|nr:hypothetical protein K4G66_22865 [Tunicatimonas sp. TK19036]